MVMTQAGAHPICDKSDIWDSPTCFWSRGAVRRDVHRRSGGRRRFMSADPRARLAELGLQLPSVSPPKGGYVPAVRSGNLVYVSGQVPMVDGELIATGKVGVDMTPERANELSQRCALAALAAIDAI